VRDVEELGELLAVFDGIPRFGRYIPGLVELLHLVSEMARFNCGGRGGDDQRH
jgi:hypothetical protein